MNYHLKVKPDDKVLLDMGEWSPIKAPGKAVGFFIGFDKKTAQFPMAYGDIRYEDGKAIFSVHGKDELGAVFEREAFEKQIRIDVLISLGKEMAGIGMTYFEPGDMSEDHKDALRCAYDSAKNTDLGIIQKALKGLGVHVKIRHTIDDAP